jgi:L-fucose isomerase-like protein
MACQECASAKLWFTNLTGIINTDSGSRIRSYLARHGVSNLSDVLENNREEGDAMFFAETLWKTRESMFLNAVFIR